jgi:predicted SnoaL-like aldol condensation-catalyzing enzyme
MSDHLEANKRIVHEFYNLAFNEKQPEEAVRRYLGRTIVNTTRKRGTDRSLSSSSCEDSRRHSRI